MFQKLFSKIPLDAAHGGTGLGFGDLDEGDLITGGAAGFDTIASVSAGSYLRSAGLLTAPVWSTVKLPNTDATGDLWYASATDTISALTIGSAGKVLRSTGTIPAWSGWTIPNTFAQGDVIYASATDTFLALVKDATATRYLSNKGVSNAPSWSQVTLTNGVTGTLAVGNGGTGISSYVTGDLIYAASASALTTLAISGGASGTFVRNNGAVSPHWSTLVLPNAATTGDVFAASATSTMGRITAVAVGSVLRAAGVSTIPAWSTFTIPNTFAAGDIIYASATNVLTALADVATGNALISGGVGVAPSWGKIALTTHVSGDLPFANFVQASAASRLVGRGSAAGAGDFEELTLGTGLTMSGTSVTADVQTSVILNSTVHTDTLTGTVVRGDIIVGNSTPKWARLAKGAANTVLSSDGTDAAWDATPGVEGLAFPATQVASANANTLDDYEEGTWTPTITFATPGDLSVVYTVQQGSYTKVGHLVRADFYVDTSTFTYTTASGVFRVAGLPFTSGATYYNFGFGQHTDINAAGYFVTIRVGPSSAVGNYQLTSLTGGATVDVDTAHVASGTTPLALATIIYRT